MFKIIKAILPNGIAIVMQFVATGLITQNTDPDTFGQWSYTYGFFTLLSSFVILGSGSLILREFSRSRSVETKEIVITHGVSVILLILLLSSPFIFAHFEYSEKITLLSPITITIAIVIATMFQGFSTLISTYFLSEKKQLLSANLMYLPKPVSITFVALGTFYFTSLEYMWVVYAIGTGILIATYFKQFLKVLKYVRIRISVNAAYIKQGAVIMLIMSHIQINAYIDGYFLLNLSSAADVGTYRLAFLFAGLGLFISNSVSRQVSPHISDFLDKKIQYAEFRAILRKHNFLSVAASISTFIVLSIAGKFILTQFYGETYLTSYYPLLAMLAGYVIKSLLGPCEMALNLSYNEKTLLLIALSGILVNALGDWMVVEQYGVMGCALVTAATTVLMMVCTSFTALFKANINTSVFNFPIKNQ